MLLILAGFLLTRIGLTIKKSIETASRVRGETVTAPEENMFLVDTDNDGIPDLSEAAYKTSPFDPDTDGDGFLDGEEIISGTDPTKDEKHQNIANNKSQNITETFADRLLAGIYEGSLVPETKKYDQSIEYLALATITDAVNSLNPPGNEKLAIASDDSKGAQEEYLARIASLLEGPFLTSFMSQPQQMQKAVQLFAAGRNNEASSIFNELSLLFTNAYTNLLTIPVPPKWQEFHSNLLLTFKKLAVNHATIGKLYDDPLLALAALNDFASIITTLETTLIQDLKLKVKNGGLTLPSSPLFDVIGILNQ